MVHEGRVKQVKLLLQEYVGDNESYDWKESNMFRMTNMKNREQTIKNTNNKLDRHKNNHPDNSIEWIEDPQPKIVLDFEWVY